MFPPKFKMEATIITSDEQVETHATRAHLYYKMNPLSTYWLVWDLPTLSHKFITNMMINISKKLFGFDL